MLVSKTNEPTMHNIDQIVAVIVLKFDKIDYWSAIKPTVTLFQNERFQKLI